jgi:integrase
MWYYIRNVPTEFRPLDGRGQILISTNIRVADDPRAVRATDIVRKLDGETFAFWHARQAGTDAEAELKYKKALAVMQANGFTFLPKSQFDTLAADEVLQRLDLLIERRSLNNAAEGAALMGIKGKAEHRLDTLLTEYEQIQSARNAKKSDAQMYRWRIVRQTALNTFMDTVGKNRIIESLTRQDIIDYHKAIGQRVSNKQIGIDAANKYLMRVATMFRAFNTYHQLGLVDIFTNLNFGKAPKNPRIPYKRDFVQDHILAEGALAGLNDEARRIVYLIVETGIRPSEACALSGATILLDHVVPHIRVKDEDREVKSESAIREIPLVGVALAAMKFQPKGFPRYRDSAGTLSYVINKYLVESNLRPIEGQSLYSLRHTFKDRLRQSHATQELMDELMGHETDGVRGDYGEGYSLEYKQEHLAKMAYRCPLVV